ncbi:MAG: hypothetical protein WDW38_009835 [Sanguina aurantia]
MQCLRGREKHSRPAAEAALASRAVRALAAAAHPLPPRVTQWDKAPGEEIERPATLRDNIDKLPQPRGDHAQAMSCPVATLLRPPQFLMADFFFVLAILAWLVVGVAQSSFNEGVSPILDAWYPLWPIVWQPALGILMAGALVSGAAGWVQELLEEQQSKKRR